MTTTKRQYVGELARWTARLWSLPLIAVTFYLAAWSFLPGQVNVAGNPFLGLLTTPYAMAFAVAFVVAWHWERVGGWLAVAGGVAFKVWITIRTGYLAAGALETLLFLVPAILFLLASSRPAAIGTVATPEPNAAGAGTPSRKPRRFFALPRTNLGWWSLLIGTGFFLFMRLFWMQAGSTGRDRSTFFSDPINAGCLIGAFGSPIVGMIVALVAVIWKRERSLLLVPLLLLGLFALLWGLAVLSGANA
jgi:hypothetical protein